MQNLFDSIYTQGDILATFIKLFIFVFSLDFILSFGSTIKSIKNSVM